MSDQTRIEMIREILLREWDPLGVGDNSNLADEYDRYLPEIVKLIEQRCNTNTLAQWLGSIEVELGLSLPYLPREQAALALSKIVK